MKFELIQRPFRYGGKMVIKNSLDGNWGDTYYQHHREISVQLPFHNINPGYSRWIESIISI